MSQRRTAHIALAFLLLAALVAAMAVAGVRLGWFAYGPGWQLMIPATALGLAALAAALAWLAAALRNNDRTGRGAGLAALCGALLLLYPPLSTVFHRLTSPAIHDFTTDTENPPRFAALLKYRGPADNSPVYDGEARVRFEGETRSLSYVLHDHYRDLLKPRAGFAIGSKDPVATFFWRDFNAMKKTGWTIIAWDEKAGRIEAVASSFWFGRPSDIVVRVRPAGIKGARTDIRSQSRQDPVDDGANAAHVKRFFRILGG
jgi:hypothetical protein